MSVQYNTRNSLTFLYKLCIYIPPTFSERTVRSKISEFKCSNIKVAEKHPTNGRTTGKNTATRRHIYTNRTIVCLNTTEMETEQSRHWSLTHHWCIVQILCMVTNFINKNIMCLTQICATTLTYMYLFMNFILVYIWKLRHELGHYLHILLYSYCVFVYAMYIFFYNWV